jgi:hypothetical protein
MADNQRNSYTDLVLGELKGEIKNIHTMRKECFADRKFKEEKLNQVIEKIKEKNDKRYKELIDKLELKATREELEKVDKKAKNIQLQIY